MILLCPLTSEAVFAEDASNTCTVTFVGFDGELLASEEVAVGDAINYRLYDTNKLQKHIDKYTEVKFHAWDYNEKYASKSVTIHALWQKAEIAMTAEPKRREYFSEKGNISLAGLKVEIIFTTQTNKLDKKGKRITEKETVNIEESCKAVPSTLQEAFSEYGDYGVISVYPPESDIPIFTYNITYFDKLGDIVSDGHVDAADASFNLSYYSKVSTGSNIKLTDEQFSYADVDRSGRIDAIDASFILKYYALKSTGKNPDWEEIAFKN